MAERPFAVFDIDGTIIRWQLYHAIADGLFKHGAIDQAAYQRVKTARMEWKRRSSSEGFRDYESELIRVFDEALSGLSVELFQEASTKVFDEYKEQVYAYTRDLIRDLQTKNYLLFAISGSPDTIVKQFADYYGFDDFAASHYAAAQGKFTGAKELAIGRKPQLLQALIAKHGAAQADSIGVGDSEGDIDMLALTEQPIAFNPSRQLFEHAQAAHWQIVVERKNMIYKLEPNGDSYQLKK
jgi:HAD superfamily phosphoserine phosphatase-like hydrolase